ncbi:hypothetical protein [Nocardia sp. NBC_00403]|uniref:hypothetical protein n=1 Tax=Nocardia sp. NBC_00403 TaxID=2975990 RepID=UPI002E1C9C7E
MIISDQLRRNAGAPLRELGSSEHLVDGAACMAIAVSSNDGPESADPKSQPAPDSRKAAFRQ